MNEQIKEEIHSLIGFRQDVLLHIKIDKALDEYHNRIFDAIDLSKLEKHILLESLHGVMMSSDRKGNWVKFTDIQQLYESR